MWELSASQSENFRLFVTPFTLSRPKEPLLSRKLCYLHKVLGIDNFASDLLLT